MSSFAQHDRVKLPKAHYGLPKDARGKVLVVTRKGILIVDFAAEKRIMTIRPEDVIAEPDVVIEPAQILTAA